MFQSALFTSFCLQFLFTYVCLDSGIVHIQIRVQGLPKARSKGQAEFWSTGARQRENQRCGGFDWWHLMGIFCFFQEFADTGKTQDTEITLYNYTKDAFFAYICFAVCWWRFVFFPAPVSEGADEAGWWDQGCEWGLRVGFVRSLFWSFLIPPFLWIYRTDYFVGAWLALRMPPPSVFQNLPVQKVRYSKQKMCKNY